MTDPEPHVAALIAKGVVIPRPDLVVIDRSVDPGRIERGAELLPGTRIEGARTLIGSGSRIGTAGPAAVRDCAIGRRVELASGAFEDSVFLDGAGFGPGGFSRGGTLFEERARAAHTVGTKHTILLPFVTLGSLINFCDCLMAGGTAEADHSEVGSGFIHFNFTPAGDKATPSLFGDVPRGAFLRERAIFLGGHSGVVGPVRIGFGSVLAAGSVFRRDCGEGVLVTGENGRGGSRPYDAAVIRGAAAKVRKNIEFLGELAALLAFHRKVRAVLAGSDAHRQALAAAAASSIADSMAERVRQLERFGLLLARSADRAPDGADPGDVTYQRKFNERLAGIRDRLAGGSQDHQDRHPGLASLARTIPAAGADYLDWVRRLAPAEAGSGVAWLESVRRSFLEAPLAAGLI